MSSIKHPPAKEFTLTEIMHALSDPTRVEIVRKLSTAKAAEQSCTALLGDRPKSSMSHHFKILRAAGLLETLVVGKEHINRLRTRDLETRFPGLLAALLAAIHKSKD